VSEVAGVKRVAVVGTGTIGASWCALFLARGLDVVANDVAKGSERTLRLLVEQAWPALTALGVVTDASMSRLRFEPRLAEACAGADFVQECATERELKKIALIATIDASVPPNVIIASSSSAFTVTKMQARCRRPERVVLGHPFNPPHLMPLVEIVGGEKSSQETLDRATAFYRALDKTPIRLTKEVYGHVANRIQAAVFREAIHLLNSGVASLEDIDNAITDGPGLRWALMGPFLTYHLAGGKGGMAAFMKQFSPMQERIWSELGTPRIDDKVQAKVTEAMRVAAQGESIEDFVARRDRSLVGLLKARRELARQDQASKGKTFP
jgi:3-hydroxyacyl-CoA dehydrogenase